MHENNEAGKKNTNMVDDLDDDEVVCGDLKRKCMGLEGKAHQNTIVQEEGCSNFDGPTPKNCLIAGTAR